MSRRTSDEPKRSVRKGFPRPKLFNFTLNLEHFGSLKNLSEILKSTQVSDGPRWKEVLRPNKNSFYFYNLQWLIIRKKMPTIFFWLNGSQVGNGGPRPNVFILFLESIIAADCEKNFFNFFMNKRTLDIPQKRSPTDPQKFYSIFRIYIGF